MKRRDFLEKTLLTSVGTAFVPTAITASEVVINSDDISLNIEETKMVYAVEAGQFGIDKTFLLGFLVFDETSDAKFNTACNQARYNFKYDSKLAYSNNDQFKKPYAMSLISNFTGATNVSFHGLVIDIEQINAKLTINDVSAKKKQLEKLEYYKQLGIAANIPERSRIIVKSQSPFGPATYLKDLYKQKFGSASSFVASNTINNNALQFAGFLAGIVRAEVMKTTTNDATKLALNAYLKQQLNIPSIGIGTIKEGKFKISAAI
jgi:hypothetical protein